MKQETESDGILLLEIAKRVVPDDAVVIADLKDTQIPKADADGATVNHDSINFN